MSRWSWPNRPAAALFGRRGPCLTAAVTQPLPSLLRPPIGFAHRGGMAHAPENTLEAFRLALRLGATGLESDAWVTADGVAVLHHDGALGTFRKRPIASLRRIQLPSHIPALEDLYDTCGTQYSARARHEGPRRAGAGRRRGPSGRRGRRGSPVAVPRHAGRSSPPGAPTRRGAAGRVNSPQAHRGGARAAGRIAAQRRASTRSTSTTAIGAAAWRPSSTASTATPSGGTRSTSGCSTSCSTPASTVSSATTSIACRPRWSAGRRRSRCSGEPSPAPSVRTGTRVRRAARPARRPGRRCGRSAPGRRSGCHGSSGGCRPARTPRGRPPRPRRSPA